MGVITFILAMIVLPYLIVYIFTDFGKEVEVMILTMNNVDAAIKQAAKDCGVTIRVEDHHKLRDDLGLDSLDVLGFIISLEDQLGIEIDDSMIETCENIADVKKLIAEDYLS